MNDSQHQITRFLRQISDGQRQALDQLMPLLHQELKALAIRAMQSERPDHTLQATALLNEAYLKLVDQTRVQWQDRAHFLAVAAQAMRRILIDHARGRGAQRRGGGWKRVEVDPAGSGSPDHALDLVALDEALVELGEKKPRMAQVVEMRYFAGLTLEEIAEVLGVTRRTVDRDWRYAQVHLYRIMQGGNSGGS